tara:strand:+ start:7239 stop:7478 length:240 start_codon:yes stop_codon:yes gene_type:complete
MRVPIDILKKLSDEFNRTLEIGTTLTSGELSLRFGYWRKVDINKLIDILPKDYTVKENLVDEDEECGGELWNYIISYGV